MAITQKNMLETSLKQSAQFLHAYNECAPPIQDAVREMSEILIAPDSTELERQHAVDVIIEALFPSFTTDICEKEDAMMASDLARLADQELDAQEQTFADRLRKVMAEKGQTQESLAKLAGVSQPAIANMLNRQCRPQQRTVERFAEILEVEPNELWPAE